MVIQLESKRKVHVLARVRAEVAPVVSLWTRQGLVADAEREVSEIVRRVSESAALWQLARGRRLPPTLLGCLLGVLVDARQAELLEGRSRREIRSAWRVGPAEVEAAAKTIASLAEAPSDEATRAMFRLDAQRYANLARSMRARDDLPHRRGRPLEPAGVIDEGVEMILGDRAQAERRAIAAALASDFTRGGIGRREVGHRQRARAARERRARNK